MILKFLLSTRGDIEQVRGVSVSPNIMRTLLERGWVRVVGQREVPGRPNMYGTTRAFLDYFNLTSLAQLPPLAEIKSMIVDMSASKDISAPLDSSQAAARLNVSRRKLDELVAGGHLRPLRIGRKRLFPQTQLDCFLRQCAR